jgi:hypothetical protein
MSSTGPGSLLVFLAFLMLSMLLAGTYFAAYLGLVQAGSEVRKAGEAASEQAIIYLFQHPISILTVGGSPNIRGETRIVIQNAGSRDITFDRVLAISRGGSVVADVKVPGNKGLGVRQWQIYRVQDLGLPERWNNFTVFSSEVSRLVLLSERGRTHGSIWGVPPFLELGARITLSTVVATTYTYTYITTTSYRTTYTITISPPQSGYSIMGEVWVSDDGKKWYRVGKGWDLYSGPITACGTDTFCDWAEYDGRCGTHMYSRRWLNNKCYGSNCLTRAGPPRIAGFNIFLSENGPEIIYRIVYAYAGSNVIVQAGNSFWQYGNSQTCECCWYIRVTEWGKRYVPQAIELVDWDTGEVYGSTNSTSLTFQIGRNTIVRFKYVRAESWSRSWTVIPPPPTPPINRCPEILNDPNERCTGRWCSCLRQFDPEAWRKEECCQPKSRSCLSVSVDFCCSGDEQYSCLASRSGRGGRNCVEFTAAEVQQGVTKPLSPVSWSASWSLKQGWVYDRIVQVGDYNPPYCTGSASGNSASGECCIALSGGRCVAGNVGPNEYYSTTVVIVFKKT